MGFDEGFADGQPEAGPPGMLSVPVTRPVETLEDVGQLVWVDARSIVDHGYDEHIIALHGADLYCVASIDQRVGDQVMHHDFYTRAIHVDCWQVVGDMRGKYDTWLTQPFDRFCDKILYTGGGAFEQE